MTEDKGLAREVSAEMRNETAIAILRKYWYVLAVVFFAVIGLVAFNEYRGFQQKSQGEANYDQIVSVNKSETPDPDVIDALKVENNAISLMELARIYRDSGDAEAALEAYRTIVENSKFDDTIRSFARLQIFALEGGTTTDLANPGEPFAVEAKLIEADSLVSSGNIDGALSVLEALYQNVEVQSERAILETLIVSLGGTLPEVDLETTVSENAETETQ